MTVKIPAPIRIKMGFRSMSHEPLVTFSSNVVDSVMAHADTFNATPIPMATVQTDVKAYASDVAAAVHNGGRQTLADRDQSRETVIHDLETLVPYIKSVAKGDISIITLSGFEVASTTRTPSQPLAQPTITNIDQGTAGQLLVTASSVGGTGYAIRIAALANGVPGAWMETLTSKVKSAIAFSGLTAGTTYAFQVRAWGPLGYTNWSDSATRMCI